MLSKGSPVLYNFKVIRAPKNSTRFFSQFYIKSKLCIYRELLISFPWKDMVVKWCLI